MTNRVHFPLAGAAPRQNPAYRPASEIKKRLSQSKKGQPLFFDSCPERLRSYLMVLLNKKRDSLGGYLFQVMCQS